MKISKLAIMALGAALAASCAGDGARLSGTLDAPAGSQLIAKSMTSAVLDTIEVGNGGKFAAKLDVKQGDPEFVDLIYGDRKIASVVLMAGDNVTIAADTLGSWTVEGSEESLKLQQVEKDYAAFISRFNATKALAESDPAEASRELTKQYIQYYRQSVKYIMENPKSITAIPVLLQNVDEGFPVFSQQTDAIHFRSVADSLAAVYPESKYVKVLDKEASRREQALGLSVSLENATQLGFPNLELPDINGQKASLDKVDAKVILVHFWSSVDATHKVLNLEALKPLYDEFHSKGLEIYAVCVDIDKVAWASTVRSQGLEWINVNDGLGTASPALAAYNIAAIPTTYMIVNGEIQNKSINGAAQMRSVLASYLK